MQGEQQEAGELRRLHLRLERANEHVNQLQSRLADQASSIGSSCSSEQAQQLEIESLRRQLAGSQASTTDSDSKEELEAQHAKQQVEIQMLRQQLQERGNGCGLERDQQLEHLKAEITQLQEALAKANAEAAMPAGAEANKQATTSHGTGVVDGERCEGREQNAQLDVVSCSEWSLDSEEAEQWCQLALQDRPTFCSQLGHLQQELQQRRADLAAQQATAGQQQATISQQADRLARAAADLTDKASALQRCSGEVAELQLTECSSVTGLQSDQLAALQAEVDQLRASLAAAEKLAGRGEAAEQLQQEVEELKSRLQVSLLVVVI